MDIHLILKKGLSYHNSGKIRSTKHRRPFEIIYYEEFERKTDAIRREKNFLKVLMDIIG